MDGVEVSQQQPQPPVEEEHELIDAVANAFSFSNSNDFDFGATLQEVLPPQPQQLQQQQQQQAEPEKSCVDAEWDPVQFDLHKSRNPNWSGKDNKQASSKHNNSKPRRIQDIRLKRLDSDGSSSSGRNTPDQQEIQQQQQQDLNNKGGAGIVLDSSTFWPYEDQEGSPCALFGSKVIMTSSPSKGFEETGEFSRGDPEWENGSRDSSRKSGRSSESREKSRRRSRRQQQAQQHEKEKEKKDEDDEGSVSLGSLGGGSDEGSHSDESEQLSDSERSLTESAKYDDDNLMVTPAMGKAREMRKKPPTLKRGAHGVQTPSIVKALKGKQAFTSDDEGDNDSIDFDEFDSDMESGGSNHSRKSKDSGSSQSKRGGRLDAANSHQRQSLTRKSSKKFNFDRSMSSADLKAARKANNSFKGTKGKMEMNKSFSALESKRRQHRKQKDMNASFSSGSIQSKKSSTRSPIPTEKTRPSKKIPTRAKSMGNPTAGGGSKLKSALSKFAGSTDEPPAPVTKPKPKASGKNYGSTLSALKALSGANDDSSADKGDASEADLKTAIMEQVFRSSSHNPLAGIKFKPKPKIQKSLSQSGMASRVSAANGILEAKEAPPRVRRSKTSMERASAQASISDFNNSYHESMAKMRKHKMADASERSAQSVLSAASQSSKVSDTSPNESSATQRPANLDRKTKSFSHPNRSAASLEKDDSEDEDPASPEKPPATRPRLKRGSSKRLQSPVGKSSSKDSKGGSRRGLQKAVSRRKVTQEKQEYDANPQTPKGTNVIALLKTQEEVTDTELMQKGNRQMFHALMFKTRMGMSMDKLRRKVEGIEDEDDEDDEEEEDRLDNDDDDDDEDDDDDADESEGSE